MIGIFHMGEVGMSHGSQCNEADFTEIHRNPGGTEHVQTVCITLFFLHTHTREPVNEATQHSKKEA